MALTPGSRLGVYEVTAQIGEGGMGQVWRGTDTTLGRQVAIKILAAAFASDPERLARFEREAKTLASLNHPHIAAIYGFEKSSGMHALVMELVDGEDLSQRLAKGAIPIDEVLAIARQIAAALEAAHEQGIVHRDLKPANVRVRPEGTVKVLDFGLAKALDQESGIRDQGVASAASGLPITTPAVTQAGMILGTAAYMAPEQATGQRVDKRADIWAFGVVLYEMLTGRRLFPAETIPQTLAQVMTRELDLAALPPTTPRHLRILLTRCLVRDPKQRLRDIGDARLMLSGAFEPLPADTAAIVAVPARRAWPLAALAVSVAAIAVMAVPTLRYVRQALPPEMRVEISTPAAAPVHFALSPDGRNLVFRASADGPPRLWLRPLDASEAQPMAGTEGAEFPFWSADSRSVGFFTATKMYRIEIAAGAPQAVANAAPGRGGTWSADGTILFVAGAANPVSRLAASGGEPVAVTRLDPPRQTGHRFPHFLPDGRHFLFFATGSPESSGIYLGSLDREDTFRLTAADTPGVFLTPNRVVYMQQGALVSRRLDLARRQLTGDTTTVADRVIGQVDLPLGGFSVSAAGQVAYRGAERRQLRWFDRTGKPAGEGGVPDANSLGYPELSPDGRRATVYRAVQNNGDIWLVDLVRGGLTRLTDGFANESNPLWSPDGTRIAFASDRTGVVDLYLTPSNATGAEELLLASSHTKAPQDWSRDGRFLLYYEVSPKTGRDLWTLDMTGSRREPRAVVNTPAEETRAQFSPDGRWVAYQTNQSGRYQIVVQSFPEPRGKSQVSTGGGVAPRWRTDGKELFYIAPDATMMAVPVTATGTTLEAGTPVGLFPTRIVGGGGAATNRFQYAVAGDGRFLINQTVDEGNVPTISLVLNWNSEGKK